MSLSAGTWSIGQKPSRSFNAPSHSVSVLSVTRFQSILCCNSLSSVSKAGIFSLAQSSIRAFWATSKPLSPSTSFCKSLADLGLRCCSWQASNSTATSSILPTCTKYTVAPSSATMIPHSSWKSFFAHEK